MTKRIVNGTDEPITIEPGGSIDLGFKGEYRIEKETTRSMSGSFETITITGRRDDG